MSIKQKIKSLWGKLRRKNTEDENPSRDPADAELSAEEVIVEEIYPQGKVSVPSRRNRLRNDAATTNKSSGRQSRARGDNSGKIDRICGKADVEPPYRAHRSRPTNDGYEMIDPSNDSADTSKS